MHSCPPHSCYVISKFHHPWLGHSNCTDEEYRLWSSSLCSFHLCHKNRSLCSFVNFRDQISHPYKTTSKITVCFCCQHKGRGHL
jgi:hypothetical protein